MVPVVECFPTGVACRVAQVNVRVRPASAVVAERLFAHAANEFVVFLYDVHFLGRTRVIIARPRNIVVWVHIHEPCNYNMSTHLDFT